MGRDGDITARMKTFYAAHNEYLELLLTSGVLGLAAWVWFVTAHLRKAAQNWLRPGVAPVTLALVSYLAHAAVSIRVSMIFPEIMLLFGLLQVFCLPAGRRGRTHSAPKGKKARQPVPNGNRPGPRPHPHLDRACRSRRGDDGGLRRGLPRGVWVPVLKANIPCKTGFHRLVRRRVLFFYGILQKTKG